MNYIESKINFEKKYSNIDLDLVIPLDKSHADFYTTGYSMDYLEEIGLLKMDFLALRNLTLIKDDNEDELLANIKFVLQSIIRLKN